MSYIKPSRIDLEWDVSVQTEDVPLLVIKEIVKEKLAVIISRGNYSFTYNEKKYVISIDKVRHWNIIRLELWCEESKEN